MLTRTGDYEDQALVRFDTRVRLTDPLNAKQLDVLRWIADGCPDGVMSDGTHKLTARALHSRRLVTITKRKGSWSATMTSTGHYYLEHGRYPGPSEKPLPKGSTRRGTGGRRPTGRRGPVTAGTPRRRDGGLHPGSSRPVHRQWTVRTHVSKPQLGRGTSRPS